jgi:hypothetical protein
MTGLITFHWTVNVDSSDWSPATTQSDAGEGRASVAAAAGDGRASVYYELSFMRLRPGMIIRAPSVGSLIISCSAIFMERRPVLRIRPPFFQNDIQ